MPEWWSWPSAFIGATAGALALLVLLIVIHYGSE